MRRLDIVFFDAGGGHRAAATALKLVIERQQRPWEVRLVHLSEVLASVDVFRKVTRIDLQEIYNLMLRKGWTLGSRQGLRFMQGVIRLMHKPAVKLLTDFWRRDAPDMVVSVVPNFNRALFEGWQAATPGRPYVTILTDLADYPPHFWMERQPQDFICGTAKAVQQAVDLGHPRERIFQASGMILHPRFYEPMEIDRAAERARLRLEPERRTGLVLFGGYGSEAMRGIQAQLAGEQLILIAGKNEKLRRGLQGNPRHHVEGFTTEVPYFMKLADYFIGKPGPASLSEALHFGLPVVTVSNAWTLPQERYNAQWLAENNYGVVLRNFRDVGAAIRRLPGTITPPPNRAVFEIVEHWERSGPAAENRENRGRSRLSER